MATAILTIRGLIMANTIDVKYYSRAYADVIKKPSLTALEQESLKADIKSLRKDLIAIYNGPDSVSKKDYKELLYVLTGMTMLATFLNIDGIKTTFRHVLEGYESSVQWMFDNSTLRNKDGIVNGSFVYNKFATSEIFNGKVPREEVIECATELFNDLKQSSNQYYAGEITLFTDAVFDTYEKLYNVIRKEIPELPQLVRVKSDLGKTSKHLDTSLLGTLSKANNMDEIIDWVNSKIKVIGKRFFLGVSPKYDGNSIYIQYYSNGISNAAFSRGQNGSGLNISSIFRKHQISAPYPEDYDAILVRYEVVMTDENFEAIMDKRNVSYANNRSVVSGILGSNEGVQRFVLPISQRTPTTVVSFSRYSNFNAIE